MSAQLRIQDGTPVWVSNSIVPSKDTVVSPWGSPRLAAVNVNSTDVFVYVKVENPGTEDIGLCDCVNVGPWSPPVTFQGFVDDANATVTERKAALTLTLSPREDTVFWPGYGTIVNQSPVSPRRAWGWSADGRFLAYINARDSTFWAFATQDVGLPNGTTIRQGLLGFVQLPTFQWTNADFGWAGSRAAFALVPNAPDRQLYALCPLVPRLFSLFGFLDGASILASVFVSPCASAIALPPLSRLISGGRATFNLFSTLAGTAIPFRQNNAPIPDIAPTGTGFSITTQTHGAMGVVVGTGGGTTVLVDDPDCTFVGGGIRVSIDRVKASTLPTANLGVAHVGDAVIGTLRQNETGWVQVPNQNGWANQSERHWCLLAQAYTVDGTTIPRPWNGQATNPPPFPIANENCAQRNIEILP